MKILSIGNSFSVDAHRYLSKIAHSAGDSFKTVNCYIGGCSLRTHYLNCTEDLKNYELQFNGEITGIKISVKDALMSDEFDVVTLQQVSGQSVNFATFEPYLSVVAEYVGKYNPHAKIYIHETWGYNPSGARLSALGYVEHAKMYEDAEAAYLKAYEKIGANGILPSGKAVLGLVESGAPDSRVFRDDIHLGNVLGRYTASLVWYEYLTGKTTEGIKLCQFDGELLEGEDELAKRCAHEACAWAEKYKR